ncbi:hypothetical protein BV22DRAFT_1030924 [Leucogyrophana mollusca]|uniref:Uncharacterized protein n=1 Tax=Leucogyrophana mollusca TaxID=85980 RepID=A0ACB8BRV1_9AGAM|nr:hypothetical protein BV22DRAFT_1030924 [Leucogyrophana mollusca]
MADRNSQYPMFSQNLMQNNISQQQMSQQGQQQQQSDSSMVPGLTNPEHGRLWQQFQNQYRSQTAGDMNAAQMNQQMADFARNQSIPHGQGQQPIVQQLQQQFGLPSQRMPVPGPSFHDSQPHTPSQSLIPPNYNNMPSNATQMKPGMSRNMMAQNRQFQLMVAQSQQNQQSTNTLDVARMSQQINGQSGQNRASPANVFSPRMQPTSDPMHASPHIPPQGAGPSAGPQPGNGQPPGTARRPTTIAELQERKSFLQATIAQAVQSIQRYEATYGSVPDPIYLPRLNAMRLELQNRKELFAKLTIALAQAMGQPIPHGVSGGNMTHMNPHSTSQSQPIQVPQVGQSQTTWMQSNSPPDANFGMGAGNGAPPQLPQQSQSQPSLNPQIGGSMLRPAAVPPQTAHTPHQLPGAAMSPNVAQQLAFQGPGGQMSVGQSRPENQFGPVPPLEKQRFESAYTSWCQNNGKEANMRVLLAENRSVDLHQLHVQVMHEGGGMQVTQRDLWAVIGGRIGFIQFPGSDGVPAKSGPGIAAHLAHAYKTYLQAFEQFYTLNVRSRAAAAITNQQANTPHAPMTVTDNTPNSSRMPPGPNPQPNGLNPQLMNLAMRYVNVSAAEMRAQGLPPNAIEIVERLRPMVLRFQQQRLLAARTQPPVPSAEPHGLSNGGPGRFPPDIHDSKLGLTAESSSSQIISGHSPGISGGSNDANSMDRQNSRQSLAVHPPQRPYATQEQLQQAVDFITTVRQTFSSRSLPHMTQLNVPDEQRLEYNKLLEQVHKATTDIDNKLPMFHMVLKHDVVIRKLVAIVVSVAQQWVFVSTGTPKYIIDYATLRNMQLEIQRATEAFTTRWRDMVKTANPQPPPNGPAPSVLPPGATQHHLSKPPIARPTPPPPPMSRPPSLDSLRPPRVNPPATSPATHPTAVATPPSAPLVSTPATNPTTPQMAVSPGTPRSPKGKVATKSKPPARPRKPSKVTAPTETPSTQTAPPPVEEPAPPVAGVKRAHPEDTNSHASPGVASSDANSAPSPKKIKTEWEGPPSDALVKKQQEIDDIKTEEDATAFLERMTELIRMTATTDNEITNDIASTLDMILRGVAQDPSDIGYSSRAGDAGPSQLSPPQAAPFDEFSEFIDYSHTVLDDEDAGSKAPTPDLLPSSSTNPSPDSGSDIDPTGHSSTPEKVKAEDSGDRLDLMHLGPLKEIDGGESAYYQADGWKWDTAMPTLDQPWAIYTTS